MCLKVREALSKGSLEGGRATQPERVGRGVSQCPSLCAGPSSAHPGLQTSSRDWWMLPWVKAHVPFQLRFSPRMPPLTVAGWPLLSMADSVECLPRAGSHIHFCLRHFPDERSPYAAPRFLGPSLAALGLASGRGRGAGLRGGAAGGAAGPRPRTHTCSSRCSRHCTRTMPSNGECSHTTPQVPSRPTTNCNRRRA